MHIKSEKNIRAALLIEKFFKWFCLISLLIMTYCWFYKDILPRPSFYNFSKLNEPVQIKSTKAPFKIRSHRQRYLITPKYEYELEGVIVTYNNADQFGNIWHKKRWQDFINLRDLCVIWGSNVKSGIYHQMKFSSDSWTCWVNSKSHAAWQKFNMKKLSNNHVLVDNNRIKKILMSTEKGDQIKFKGMLASYENLNNGFKRGTSITRDDKGNGACETVYLTSIEIIKKANQGIRKIYKISKWSFLLSLIAFICLLGITPKIVKRNK